MSTTTSALPGPDLALGVQLSSMPDGTMLLGHAGGEAVLLVRRDDELFAIGASCTHYGAPLSEGLLVDDTVRCPWHHACFSLRTGAVLRAPARDPLPRCRKIGRRHSLALDTLAENLFKYLTQECGREPEAIAQLLWQDWQHAGRREKPAFLASYLSNAEPAAPRPSSDAPKRQARHMGLTQFS